MKTNKEHGIDLKKFKKYLLKQVGKRCKDYGMACFTCIAYRVYDDLSDLKDVLK